MQGQAHLPDSDQSSKLLVWGQRLQYLKQIKLPISADSEQRSVRPGPMIHPALAYDMSELGCGPIRALTVPIETTISRMKVKVEIPDEKWM